MKEEEKKNELQTLTEKRIKVSIGKESYGYFLYNGKIVKYKKYIDSLLLREAINLALEYYKNISKDIEDRYYYLGDVYNYFLAIILVYNTNLNIDGISYNDLSKSRLQAKFKAKIKNYRECEQILKDTLEKEHIYELLSSLEKAFPTKEELDLSNKGLSKVFNDYEEFAKNNPELLDILEKQNATNLIKKNTKKEIVSSHKKDTQNNQKENSGFNILREKIDEAKDSLESVKVNQEKLNDLQKEKQDLLLQKEIYKKSKESQEEEKKRDKEENKKKGIGLKEEEIKDYLKSLK